MQKTPDPGCTNNGHPGAGWFDIGLGAVGIWGGIHGSLPSGPHELIPAGIDEIRPVEVEPFRPGWMEETPPAASEAPARPGSCFLAGTPVHTTVGLKAIEKIAPGDRVIAYDHQHLRWAEREVLDVYQLLHQGPMATVQVKGETLRATGGHPFWVVRGEDLAERPSPVRIAAYEVGGRQEGRWMLARDLRADDEVLLRQGEVVPTAIASLA